MRNLILNNIDLLQIKYYQEQEIVNNDLMKQSDWWTMCQIFILFVNYFMQYSKFSVLVFYAWSKCSVIIVWSKSKSNVLLLFYIIQMKCSLIILWMIQMQCCLVNLCMIQVQCSRVILCMIQIQCPLVLVSMIQMFYCSSIWLFPKGSKYKS